MKRIRVPITPGSLIYVDVWGPCDTISLINESVYTIGFIDAATKKAWLYQRRKKSDILECLKHFYETVIIKRRASHGLKDFVVQSDNGEFKSDAILKFLHSVGGDRRTCCAYTPEIMAFIERLWGIINSMASAMLIDKGLPEEFWEFAQNYALDIYITTYHLQEHRKAKIRSLQTRSLKARMKTQVYTSLLVVEPSHIFPNKQEGRIIMRELTKVCSLV